jgi:hypothetical protein
MASARRYLWIGGIGVGLLLVAVGIFFVVQAQSARTTTRAALADEGVVTNGDASIPGVPVTDARTAQAQADVIKTHSIDRYGTYVSMERDDPNRAVYLDGLTLRNALGLAVLGFGVSDLALVSGLVILVLGVATLGLGVPVLYWLRVPSAERPRLSAAGREPLAAVD